MPINFETINSFFKKNFNPEQAYKFVQKKLKNIIKKVMITLKKKPYLK
jgi:UDP-galactopyranose mutase